MRRFARRIMWPVAVLVAGFGLIGSTGCEKQTMTTIQNGIIDASSAALGSVMQAAIALAMERANGTTP